MSIERRMNREAERDMQKMHVRVGDYMNQLSEWNTRYLSCKNALVKEVSPKRRTQLEFEKETLESEAVKLARYFVKLNLLERKVMRYRNAKGIPMKITTKDLIPSEVWRTMLEADKQAEENDKQRKLHRKTASSPTPDTKQAGAN